MIHRKQEQTRVLALALATCCTGAMAAEGGGTDAAPMRTAALSHHVAAVDDVASPAPSGVGGAFGYLFVAGSAFSPRSSASPMTYAGGGCIKSTNDFVATDLQLPDGITVLGIRSYYYNNGQAGNVSAALTTYDGAGAFTDHVIGASTLNTGYADEYFALTTPLVIDNLSRSHVLLGQTAADMLFCGIRVYFQYP